MWLILIFYNLTIIRLSDSQTGPAQIILNLASQSESERLCHSSNEISLESKRVSFVVIVATGLLGLVETSCYLYSAGAVPPVPSSNVCYW